MKIIFNLLDTGLGNNGGSLTLIKSANTLKNMGHEVICISSCKNQNTWEKLNCEHIINKFPDNYDLLISTGIRSVLKENLFNTKNKSIWIRGWETWNFPENKIISIYKNSNSIKLVNSICLEKKLKFFNISSYIIRPGYDFEKIYPLNIRENNKKIIIGGLYNYGAKRINKRTEWIKAAYEKLKKKYDIELYMFGGEGAPNFFTNKYLKNPDIEEKNYLYNKIDIWLSPSCLEGLHIAPAEAMLTESCVIGNDSELNGTSDYLINDETGIVSKNILESFIKNIENIIINKNKRLAISKNGRKKILMIGDRVKNLNNLINIFN